MKLRTAHGFMSGAKMVSSVPSIQISSVHYPLSSRNFLFYLLLHHSHFYLLFTGFSNDLHTLPPLLPPTECSHVQNNWYLLE